MSEPFTSQKVFNSTKMMDHIMRPLNSYDSIASSESSVRTDADPNTLEPQDSSTLQDMADAVAAMDVVTPLPTVTMPQPPSLTPSAPFELLAATPHSPAFGVINKVIAPVALSPAITSAAIEEELALCSHEPGKSPYNDDHTPDERRSLLKYKKLDRNQKRKTKKVAHTVQIMVFIASLGGFLTGYNVCVLSGALLSLSRKFGLSDEQEELIVCTGILFAFLASLIGGHINTYLGRRQSLMLVALLFCVGDLLLTMANDYLGLIFGQVLVGIAIGIESLTSSLYVAEIAPPAIRGKMVGTYTVAMSCGQFGAGLVAGMCGADRWRLMFGFCLLPAFGLYLGAAVFLPESPAWFVATQNVEKAQSVLMNLRVTKNEVLNELQELIEIIRMSAVTSATSNQVVQSHDSSGGGASSTQMNGIISIFRHTATRRALFLGSGLMIVQQLCGVNTVMYYSATIYESAGFSEDLSIWLSAATTLAQFIGLCLSVAFVESTGRRMLTLLSLGLSGVSLSGLGLSFYFSRIYSQPVIYADAACGSQSAMLWDGITTYAYDCVLIDGCGFVDGNCVQGEYRGPLDPSYTNEGGDDEWQYNSCDNPYGLMSVFFMVMFLVVFGLGMGGLPRTIASEIFVPSHRNVAVSIATAFNWISNLLISVSFLTISSPAVFTQYGAFGAYSFISFVGTAWLYFILPETAGLSISEIEKMFSDGTEPGIKVHRSHSTLQLGMSPSLSKSVVGGNNVIPNV